MDAVCAFLFAGRSLYEEARADVDWPDAILETLPFRAAATTIIAKLRTNRAVLAVKQ